MEPQYNPQQGARNHDVRMPSSTTNAAGGAAPVHTAASAREATTPSTPPIEKKSSLPMIVGALALVLLVGGGGYWFVTQGDADGNVEQSAAVGAVAGEGTVSEQQTERNAEVLAKIGALMVLPDDGVDPALALVEDAEALKAEQSFFENAQNGDYLVVYPTRAIIYRESTNVIINVGPVIAGGDQPAPAPTTEE